METPPDPAKVLEPVSETAKLFRRPPSSGPRSPRLSLAGGRWLDGVLGDTIRDVVGLLVGDRVHYARLRAAVADEERLAQVVHLAKDRIDAIDPEKRRSLPPKVGLAWIGNASVEDDESLQAKWAALLVSAIDNSEDPVTKAYVTILAELDVEDAVALEDYYQNWLNLEEKPFHADGVTYGPGLTVRATAAVWSPTYSGSA